MLIAIIDDGIDPTRFGIGKLHFHIAVTEQGNVVPDEILVANTSIASHGTTCAGIIRKYAPGSELGSIRILDRSTLLSSCCQLVSALNWCAAQHIPIIHMSLGSTYYSDFPEIQRAVLQLTHQGQIVIAAGKNNGVYSAPAYFPNVLGVKAEASLQDDQYEFIESAPGDLSCLASGHHMLFDANGVAAKPLCCNSFAAPVITAKVHEKQKETIFPLSFPALLDALAKEKQASPAWQLFCKTPDFIDDAFLISDGDFPTEPFFTVSQTIRSDDLSGLMLKRSSDIVIAGAKDGYVADFVRRNSAYIHGVVYAGSMPNLLTLLCEKIGCLFWEESAYRKWCELIPMTAASPDIPIVTFRGEPNECMRLMLELKKCFCSQDYFCGCISETPKCYLSGFIYLFPDENPEKFVRYWVGRRGWDILLLYTNSHLWDPCSEDAVVQVGGENSLHKISNSCFLFSKNGNSSELFQKLLEHYSE